MTRRPPPGPPRPPSRMAFDLKPTPLVLRLIIIHVALWFVMAVTINFGGVIDLAIFSHEHLAVSAHGTINQLNLWQPFTYMWLHDYFDPGGGAPIGHIFFNMLFLFFLGPPLERRWGKRTFLKFYVLTGIIAGLFTVLVGLILPGWFGDPTVGASGALMGLLVGFSLIMPNAQILLFFIIPIRAKYIVWIAVAMDSLFFFASSPGSNRVAIHAHLGGVLGGWLLITGNWRPRTASARLRLWLNKGKGKGNKDRRGFRVLDGGKKDDDDYLH